MIINEYKQLISVDKINLLYELIGKRIISFDFSTEEYLVFNHKYSLFEIGYPGSITLVTSFQKITQENIEFTSQNSLNIFGGEFVNLIINSSIKDYSKGRGIMFNRFEILSINIYSNNRTLLAKEFNDNNEKIRTLSDEYPSESTICFITDEIILFQSTDNQRIILIGTEGLNGTVIISFDENYIDKVITNQQFISSPRKNYQKRLTLQK